VSLLVSALVHGGPSAPAGAAVDGTAGASSPSHSWSIRPEVRTAVVWNDNVFHDRRNREGDLAFGIAPSVSADYNRERWRVGGDLGADARVYLDHSELNETFWNVQAYGEIEPRPGLMFRVADYYVPQPIELGRPYDDTSNLQQSNTLLAEARYWRELKRGAAFELGIRGTRFTTDTFDASVDTNGDGSLESFSDFRSDYWGGRFFAEARRPFGRRLEGFVRGEYQQRDYDEIESADYYELSGLVGVRARYGRRLSGEVMVGWGRPHFDGLANDGRFIGRLILNYQPRPDWRIRVSLLRRLTGDANGTDFDETSARLGVEKDLGRRTRAYAGIWWSRTLEDLPGRDHDQVIGAELRLRRQITRHIEGVLAYRHWENDGAFEEDDFTQNRVTLALVYRY
jgi:hypothetical protein